MITKSWMKRAVAVGLIALMAVVNPLQNLSAGDAAPSVARAAESDNPYVGEVRIAADKDPEKAKQILISAGYEVVDQDLNEDAGSIWNKTGDIAVYMGIKRTADENKAIRDMKVMNMLGKYSYSDLKTRIEENKSQAKEIYRKLNTAIGEYAKNFKANDMAAAEAHEMMNLYKEDDSGKLIGDFFLEENTEEQIIKLLAEGNIYNITAIGKSLSYGAEEATDEGATWLDRITKVTSYNMVVKRYAKQIYGTENVFGENKENVEKRIEADLDDTASTLLANWDDIRSTFTNEEENEQTIDEFIDNEGEENNVIELSKNVADLTTAEYAKVIPYGKKTLYDLFTVPAATFQKNIKNLYPLVYALSEGQRALADTVEISDLFQAAVIRKTAEDEKSKMKKLMDDVNKKLASDAEIISVYEGVDRDQFSDNAAMTSQATANMSAGDNKTLLSEGVYKALYNIARVTAVVAGIIFTFAHFALKYAIDEVEYLTFALNSSSAYAEAYWSYNSELKDTFVAQTKYLPVVKWIAFGLAVVSLVTSAVLYYIDQKEKYNKTQLPIPEVMVDYDTENEAGRYVTYHAVKWNRERELQKGEKESDRADRADLNGDAAREWLALYTTADKAMGEPILADDIVANVGDSGIPAPTGNGSYVPLTIFGMSSVQNLVDQTYSFNDEVGGIWLWYQKGSSSKDTVIEDDTDDGQEETLSEDITDDNDEEEPDDTEAVSGSAAETTGSNISGGTMVLGITGGAVGGLIIGLLIGVFFRRKKTVQSK